MWDIFRLNENQKFDFSERNTFLFNAQAIQQFSMIDMKKDFFKRLEFPMNKSVEMNVLGGKEPKLQMSFANDDNKF